MRYDDHLNTLYLEAEKHFSIFSKSRFGKAELFKKWREVLESAYEYGVANGKTQMYGERVLLKEDPTRGDGEWI